MRVRVLAPLAAALLLDASLLAAPAGAEIYKCKGPDGKVSYSSHPSSCSGAKPHEIRGEVQTIRQPAARSRAALRRNAPAPGADASEAQAAMWRGKRLRAEQELVTMERRVDAFKQLSTWCNRGGSLFTENAAALKEDYSCGQARTEYDQARSRVAQLRTYLDTGLAEECRRSGCLPGWIR